MRLHAKVPSVVLPTANALHVLHVLHAAHLVRLMSVVRAAHLVHQIRLVQLVHLVHLVLRAAHLVLPEALPVKLTEVMAVKVGRNWCMMWCIRQIWCARRAAGVWRTLATQRPQSPCQLKRQSNPYSTPTAGRKKHLHNLDQLGNLHHSKHELNLRLDHFDNVCRLHHLNRLRHWSHFHPLQGPQI